VQRSTVRYIGLFLEDPLAVPWSVVEHLAAQLGIEDPSVVKQYRLAHPPVVRPGTILRMGPGQGEFILPEPPPARLLFLTGGIGVTPVAAMLRALTRRSCRRPDTVWVPARRTPGRPCCGGRPPLTSEAVSRPKAVARAWSLTRPALPQHGARAVRARSPHAYACLRQP
jgi:hypothetical protein